MNNQNRITTSERTAAEATGGGGGGVETSMCLLLWIFYFFLYFPGDISSVDHLCYLCLVFVMLSHLFIAAVWSPPGKGLISWLLFVMFNCVFITFPCGILGQVWYLIISFPNFCRLSYLDIFYWPNMWPSCRLCLNTKSV